MPENGFFITSRFIAYFCITALVFRLIVAAIKRYRLNWVFREDSLAEWLQFSVLIAAVTVMAWAAVRRPHFKQVFISCAAILLMAVVRELDSFLTRYVHPRAWGVFDLMLFGALLVYGLPRRAAIRVQLHALASTRVFGMLWCGFLAAMCFARMLGTKGAWHAILVYYYSRDPGRMLEESAELFGYLIILYAAIEMHFERGFCEKVSIERCEPLGVIAVQ